MSAGQLPAETQAVLPSYLLSACVVGNYKKNNGKGWKKIMKKFFAGLMVTGMVIVSGLSGVTGRNITKVYASESEENLENLEEGTLEFYQMIAENLEEIQIVDSSEIIYEMLINRNGKIIIEKCIGKVIDNELNGEIWNAANEEYNYISYSGVTGAQAGNIILTYFIYNPDTIYEDDIIFRFDYIIDSNQ